MTENLHARHRHQYALALAGIEPAEALPTRIRHNLVHHLWCQGLTDQQIADHTRMTLYTTARIRRSLNLDPHLLVDQMWIEAVARQAAS